MLTGSANVEVAMLLACTEMRPPYPVALPWYEPQDYEALQGSLSDGASLPLVYETWRMATEQVEQQVLDCGVKVVRVPIRPDEFAAWCAENDLVSDGAARSKYATEILDAGANG